MDEIRKKLKDMIEAKQIDLVIGYGQKEIAVSDGTNLSTVVPLFLTQGQEMDQLVWNHNCSQNLVQYLTKKDYMEYKKVAIFVKPCDIKAITVL